MGMWTGWGGIESSQLWCGNWRVTDRQPSSAQVYKRVSGSSYTLPEWWGRRPEQMPGVWGCGYQRDLCMGEDAGRHVGLLPGQALPVGAWHPQEVGGSEE